MGEDLPSSVWHKFVGVYKKSQRCIRIGVLFPQMEEK